MGASLYIQRSNGVYADSPIATVDLALEAYDSIPWRDEFEHFSSLSHEERNGKDPEFGLINDSGRIIRIFPYSLEWTAFTYSYPILEALDGSQEARFVTDSLPAALTHDLIRLYFSPDHRPILKLLNDYPNSQNSNTAEQGAAPNP